MRAAAACLLLSARVAAASTPEVIGLGAEESALAGASTARVHDFSAVHYNPAGLTQLRVPEVSLGVVGFGSQLKIHTSVEHTQDLANPVSVVIGAAAPIPLGGFLKDHLFIGLALGIVPGMIVRVIGRTPETPFYPLYDNRTQRLVVIPGGALRLGPVSFGIGLNFLAGLVGFVDAGEGPQRAIEARADEQIVARAAANAGIRWQIDKRWAVGLTYRQQFSVPFSTVARTVVAGQPLDLSVAAEELFTPHTLVAGAALYLRRLVLSLDLSWAHWSAWQSPYLRVDSALPLVGAIVAAPPPTRFDDTAAVRAGVAWRFSEKRFSSAELRAGYAFESAAMSPHQPGVTNLLDGHKHRLAAGLGVRFDLLGGNVRLDAHGQLDAVQPVTIVKDPAPSGTIVTNPGYPSVSGGGVVWALGASVTVEVGKADARSPE